MQRDLAVLGWAVHALDMLGHGSRTVAGGTLSVEDLARDLMAQAPGPVDLVVGHSLGSIVALTAAGLDPGYTKAVLLDGGYTHRATSTAEWCRISTQVAERSGQLSVHGATG